MIFVPLPLNGAHLIDVEPRPDERGFFVRTWCAREFAARGLNTRLAECAVSFNRRRGTLRGLHYQVAPHAQAKLVQCARGAIHDVIVDLRPESPTYRQWSAVTLTEASRRMLYVPEGFAHGFQTMEDATEVLYHLSDFYHPAAERGIRWDDPGFAIVWPEAERTVSSRDQTFADFRE